MEFPCPALSRPLLQRVWFFIGEWYLETGSGRWCARLPQRCHVPRPIREGVFLEGTPGFPGLVQTVCYLPQASRPREVGLHSPGIPLGGHICICKCLGPCPPRLPAVLSHISTALLWNSTGTGTCSGSQEHSIRRVVTQKGCLSRCYSGPQSCGTQTVWNRYQTEVRGLQLPRLSCTFESRQESRG